MILFPNIKIFPSFKTELNKNLNETKYNDNTNITLTPDSQNWIASLNNGNDTSCYYFNTSSYSSSLEGNIDPATGECSQFPVGSSCDLIRRITCIQTSNGDRGITEIRALCSSLIISREGASGGH